MLLLSTIMLLAQSGAVTESAWYTVGQIVGPFLIGLLAGVMPKIIGWFKKKKKGEGEHPHINIEDTTQDDLRMQDLITELRMRSEADRVVIYLFHNGGCFFDGSPIKKISMVYETVKLGVSYVSGESKDIITSHIPDLINVLMNSSPCMFKTSDINTGFWKHLLESRNVTYSMYNKITNGPRIVGYVGLNYCGEQETGVLDTAEKTNELSQLLEEYASKMEIVLSRRIGNK